MSSRRKIHIRHDHCVTKLQATVSAMSSCSTRLEIWYRKNTTRSIPGLDVSFNVIVLRSAMASLNGNLSVTIRRSWDLCILMPTVARVGSTRASRRL